MKEKLLLKKVNQWLKKLQNITTTIKLIYQILELFSKKKETQMSLFFIYLDSLIYDLILNFEDENYILLYIFF